MAPARGRKAKGPDKRLAPTVWLKDAAEDFVLESFLPQIWMDLRARCTAALEATEAFRTPVGEERRAAALFPACPLLDCPPRSFPRAPA